MRTALKVINCSKAPEEVCFFMTEAFPAVPQKGDLIDVPEMIRDQCDEATANGYEQLTWFVDHVVWCKDEEGIYAEVVCKCSETAVDRPAR